MNLHPPIVSAAAFPITGSVAFPITGSIFSGASSSGPPDKDQLVQWLNYLKDDGITLNDKLDLIRPAPTLTDIGTTSFDGVDGMGDTGFVGGLSSTSTWEVELYAAFPALPVPNGKTLISEFQDGRGGIWIRGAGVDQFRFRDTDGTAYTGIPLVSTNPLFDSGFHHIKVRYDGNNTIQFFVDDMTVVFDTIDVPTGVTFSPERIMFQSVGQYTASQMAWLRVSGATTDGVNELLMDYRFSETEGDTVYNRAQDAYHMTLSGGYSRTSADGLYPTNHMEGFYKEPYGDVFFDGIDDSAATGYGQDMTGSWEVEWYGAINDTVDPTNMSILGGLDGRGGIWVKSSAGSVFRIRNTDGTYLIGDSVNHNLITNEYHHVKLSYDGVNTTLCYVDDMDNPMDTILGSPELTPDLMFLQPASNYFSTNMKWMKITDNGTLVMDYQFDQLTGTTIPNQASGSYDLTVSGSPVLNAASGALVPTALPTLPDLHIVAYGQSNCRGAMEFSGDTQTLVCDLELGRKVGGTPPDNPIPNTRYVVNNFSDLPNVTPPSEHDSGVPWNHDALYTLVGAREWATELTLGQKLAKIDKGRVVVSKVSHGGTQIEYFMKGLTGGLYEILLDQINALIAEGEPVPQLLIFDQGGADANKTIEIAQAYQPQAEQLFADLRADINPNLKILLITIGHSYNPTVEPALTVYNAQKAMAAADPNVEVMDAMAYEWQNQAPDDTTHYSCLGQTRRGYDAYPVVREMLSNLEIRSELSATGMPLTHSGCSSSGAHNGSECGIVQNSAWLISPVTVDNTVLCNGKYYTESEGVWALRNVEVLQDNGFDVPGDWNANPGWTVLGSRATHDGTNGDHYLYQVSAGVAGSYYSLSVNVLENAGTGILQFVVGGNRIDIPEGHLGIFTALIEATSASTTTGVMARGGWDGAIDDLSMVRLTEEAQKVITFTTQWVIASPDLATTYFTHTAPEADLPPTSGWVAASGSGTPALTIGEDTFWSTGEELVPKYWQDFVDHPNGQINVYMKFIQDPSCKVAEVGTYPRDYDPDTAQQIKLHKYWNVGTCGTIPPPSWMTFTLTFTTGGATHLKMALPRNEAADVTGRTSGLTHYAYGEVGGSGYQVFMNQAGGLDYWEFTDNAGHTSQTTASIQTILPPLDGWTQFWSQYDVTFEYGDTTGTP